MPPLPDVSVLREKVERLFPYVRSLALQQGNAAAVAMLDQWKAVYDSLVAGDTLVEDDALRARLFAVINTAEGILARLQNSSPPSLPPEPGRPPDPIDSSGTVIRPPTMPPIMPPIFVPDSAAIAARLDRMRAFVDSAAVNVASAPNLPATDLIARAVAVIDSAQERLLGGQIGRAFVLQTRAADIVARLSSVLLLRSRVVDGLTRVEAHLDSLVTYLAGAPNARASEALAAIPALLDSVADQLADGRVLAADRTLERAKKRVQLAHEIIRFEAQLTRALAGLQERIGKAETIVAASGDTAAVAFLSRAQIAADSAAAAMSEQELHRAAKWIEHGDKALARAIFVATAPQRIAGEIASLRSRMARLLATLPLTAVRERAIVQRASPLVDSAQVALDAGLLAKAETLVQKVRYALDTLIRQPVPMPQPMPPITQLPVDSVVALVRQWVARALMLNDTADSDSIRVAVDGVMALLQQIPVALEQGQRELAVQLASKALAMIVGVTQTASADVAGQWGTDPIVQELIKAGEDAARASQAPTDVETERPEKLQYTLVNTPNPFNPSTRVQFTLAVTEQANLTVYNMLGQEMRVLTSGVRSAGTHEVVWDGRDASGISLASGIYFARLQTQSTSLVIRMVLSR
jgi:hypothetical protein